MDDLNQIEIPPAFVALYVPPGRTRPTLSREQLSARHAHCDDLATMLLESAQALRASGSLTPQEVLGRIGRGLQDPSCGFAAGEVDWVVGRLAELLDWPLPLPPG